MQVCPPFWSSSTSSVLTAVPSTTSVIKYQFWDGTAPAPTVYSDYVTCTAVGGSLPYTYLWTEVGGPSGIAIVSSTSATTRFSGYAVSGDFAYDGNFICTVTDSLGATAATVSVNVQIERST